jgi:hypothetical protein
VAIFCAQRRGDLAGPLFEDVLKRDGEGCVKELFSVIREAITVTMSFVGLPNTMPASFGLIAQLKQRNITEVPIKPRSDRESTRTPQTSDVLIREHFQQQDYLALGHETHKKIYRGVGNPEVSQMLAQYLPDLCKRSTILLCSLACMLIFDFEQPSQPPQSLATQ